MLAGKWWTFSAAALLSLASGFNATFGLYAPDLRAHYNYTHMQEQGIGSALVTAGLFAIIPGLLFDWLSKYPRIGPRYVQSTHSVL